MLLALVAYGALDDDDDDTGRILMLVWVEVKAELVLGSVGTEVVSYGGSVDESVPMLEFVVWIDDELSVSVKRIVVVTSRVVL